MHGTITNLHVAPSTVAVSTNNKRLLKWAKKAKKERLLRIYTYVYHSQNVTYLRFETAH